MEVTGPADSPFISCLPSIFLLLPTSSCCVTSLFISNMEALWKQLQSERSWLLQTFSSISVLNSQQGNPRILKWVTGSRFHCIKLNRNITCMLDLKNTLELLLSICKSTVHLCVSHLMTLSVAHTIRLLHDFQ